MTARPKRFRGRRDEHKPECVSDSSGRAVHATGAQQRDGRTIQQRPARSDGEHADGSEAAVSVRVRPEVSRKPVPVHRVRSQGAQMHLWASQAGVGDGPRRQPGTRSSSAKHDAFWSRHRGVLAQPPSSAPAAVRTCRCALKPFLYFMFSSVQVCWKS